jgi:class 3 adenylate cyclase
VERFPTAPIWPALLACLLAETARLDEARLLLQRMAADDFAAVRDAALAHSTYFLLADACFAAEIIEHAARLYELFEPWSERFVTAGGSVSLGSAARPLGNLAAMLGRFDVAVCHFETAIDIETRMRALGLLPRAQCDYAKMLLARHEPGDREKAIALLDQALETSQRLGLKGWLDLCLETKLRALGLDASSLGPKGSIDIIASTFGSAHPDLAPHAAPDGKVTLMFSDMEGFAAMTDRLGDHAAREVIRAHNAIVREQTSAHDGHEVELQGDGFLLAFSSARRALECAIAIQRAFAAYSEANPEEPIRVRIGLHTGKALRDADKFFGKTVILAARIAAQASGGEILASSLLKDLTESTGDLRFGKARDVQLKGISDTQRIYAVEWQ